MTVPRHRPLLSAGQCCFNQSQTKADTKQIATPQNTNMKIMNGSFVVVFSRKKYFNYLAFMKKGMKQKYLSVRNFFKHTSYILRLEKI